MTQLNKMIGVGEANIFFSPVDARQILSKNTVKLGKWDMQLAQRDEPESCRIKSLEDELSHYRCMLDKMVRQRTEMLEQRLSIMASCNSTLCENYHQMHKMYLDLLVKIQIYEADMNLRTLEGELATLPLARE
jgi:K+/H+ antiporter YhaU regulatory subunit KhtT